MRKPLSILIVGFCLSLLPLASRQPAPPNTAAALLPMDTLMPSIADMSRFTLVLTAAATQPTAPRPTSLAAAAQVTVRRLDGLV